MALLRDNQSSRRSPPRTRAGTAVIGMTLSLFMLTIVGAWVEARWPNPAGTWITVRATGSRNPADTAWQLRHIEGVQDVAAFLAGSAPLDETENIPWTSIALYAVQSSGGEAGSLSQIPLLSMAHGRLPSPLSLDEVALSHEVAQVLQLRVGDVLPIAGRVSQVVGIGRPSARWQGNWLHVSANAAERISSASGLQVDHFAVEPEGERDPAEVAARIRRTMPDVEVLSPAAELAAARQEHAVLLLAICSTAALALLVSLPLLGDLAEKPSRTALLAAVASGTGALAFGWLATLLANGYARDVLGLTPFHVSVRLAVAVPGASVFMNLLARRRLWPRAWPFRNAITVMLLAVCGSVLLTVGALNESLALAVSEAQRAAANWVAVGDMPVGFEMMQAMYRMPGIRGYVLEAYGGPASEDDSRWLGVWPPSGVLYGVLLAGAEGTLSLPYHLGFWRGGPLDVEAQDEAVIGFDLAQAQRLGVGDRMVIRGTSLIVVGIRNRLPYNGLSDANWRADVTLDTLRRLLRDPSISGQLQLLIPPADKQDDKTLFLDELRRRLRISSIVTVDDRLAELAARYPIAWTLTAGTSQARVQHAHALYGNLLLVCTVALLSVVAIAVAGAFGHRLDEDERRVTLLKAFGMEDGKFLGEYLEQALVLAVSGGLLGIGIGRSIVNLINRLAPPLGVELLVTPWLAATVFVAMLATCAIAIAVPAGRAMRQDAVPVLFKSP